MDNSIEEPADYIPITKNRVSENAKQYKHKTVVNQKYLTRCKCKPDKKKMGCYDENCLRRQSSMDCDDKCTLKDNCQNKRFQNVSYL